MKKKKKILFNQTFELWFENNNNEKHTYTKIAKSEAKAKYQLFKSFENYHNNEFFEFLKGLKYRCIGKVKLSDYFPKGKEAIEMFIHVRDTVRNMPFIKLGMKVQQGGKDGFIIGNRGGNWEVYFPEEDCSANCHPTWDIIYFDNNNNVIKDFSNNSKNSTILV